MQLESTETESNIIITIIIIIITINQHNGKQNQAIKTSGSHHTTTTTTTIINNWRLTRWKPPSKLDTYISFALIHLLLLLLFLCLFYLSFSFLPSWLIQRQCLQRSSNSRWRKDRATNQTFRLWFDLLFSPQYELRVS